MDDAGAPIHPAAAYGNGDTVTVRRRAPRAERLPRPLRWLMVGLGFVFLSIGLIGVVVPLLPTTPFLLLTAFFFATGNDRLHGWLVAHPRLGPPLRAWWDHGAVPLRAKWLASVMIVASVGASLTLAVDAWAVRIVVGLVALGVVLWLWSRPVPPQLAASDP